MPKIAYLFPGQGAQSVGMGRAFYDQFEEAKEVYKAAKRRLDRDVAELCFDGPPEALTKTDTCQPALFATSLAAFAAFKRQAPSSLTPLAAAGLSLGELTALAAAEAFSLNDGFYLVQARGEAMAECAEHSNGAMLAVVGLAPDQVQEVCQASGAWGANYNSADQVVLSGTSEAIGKAEGLANEKGAKRAIKLDVAGAFHSPLMQPAADLFKKVISAVEFRKPKFPVISNVTGKPVEDPGEIPDILVKQIVSPVRWESSMRYLIDAGLTHTVEFPPAKVLTAMMRRIDKEVKTAAINEPNDFEKLSDILTVPAQ